MKREDQSSLVDEILMIAKKEEKEPDEKEKAVTILKRFKHPKHKLHVKKHLDKLEKGQEPKKVMKDFFKGLGKVSTSDVRFLRQLGLVKKEGNVYKNTETDEVVEIA